ncbi:MAG: 3-phosphoshikimate 1-carboxyvinyltransferase [Chloroflexi bacterium]|nr:3-phosphoshikimate 1-carboxyvinyltransferase [Chloroflexota bacterium]
MQDPLPIRPLDHPIDAVVDVPGSKSYTNRALIIAAMADGFSTIRGALFSDDTERMADSLRRLGIRVEEDASRCEFQVWGAGGTFPAPSGELFVGDAGTAARFLTAFLALGNGEFRLDGDSRMRERPIGPLLDALNDLGVEARSEVGNGCPPLIIKTSGLQGGEVTMPGDQSSQYFSALLMVGPLTRNGLVIHVQHDLVSKPYIDLTADIMRAFGATMTRDANYELLTVAGNQSYSGRDYFVEPDASNASYFFGAAAITGGRVRIEHLDRASAQGDLEILNAFRAMGCQVRDDDGFIEVVGPPRLRGITVDANAYSDMALTLCAIAPFAEGPTEIRNIGHTRFQESDRIAAATAELRRLGQEVEEFRDGLRITPRPVIPATVRTYQDHRVAMAFALVGLKTPGVAIQDPSCTSKTFPEYWDRLEDLRVHAETQTSANGGGSPPRTIVDTETTGP